MQTGEHPHPFQFCPVGQTKGVREQTHAHPLQIWPKGHICTGQDGTQVHELGSTMNPVGQCTGGH